MSELSNPLFDDEKEFLERKKLEYERALVADVEELKDKSVAVGKVAAIGGAAVGGIWLLAKLFGGKKRQGDHGANRRAKSARKSADRPAAGFAPADEFYTDGLGQRHRAVPYHKSAAQSAAVFSAHQAADPRNWFDVSASDEPVGYDGYQDDLADDGGFGAGFGFAEGPAPATALADFAPDDDDFAAHADPDLIGAAVFARAYAAANTANATNQTKHRQAEAEAEAEAGQETAPARQAPATPPAAAALPFAAGQAERPAATEPAGSQSTALSADLFAEPASARPEAVIPPRANGSVSSLSRLAGAGVRSFLQSETGRRLLAQASAVALALITKQVGQWRANDQPTTDGAPVAASASSVVPATVSVAAPVVPPSAAPAVPKPRRAATTNKNADLAAAPAVAPAETAAPRPQNAAPSDDSNAPSLSPA